MPVFVINKGTNDEHTVMAERYRTEGDFIDFTDEEGIKLRLRAADVLSVERQQS